jgi:hypothetical protein
VRRDLGFGEFASVAPQLYLILGEAEVHTCG